MDQFTAIRIYDTKINRQHITSCFTLKCSDYTIPVVLICGGDIGWYSVCAKCFTCKNCNRHFHSHVLVLFILAKQIHSYGTVAYVVTTFCNMDTFKRRKCKSGNVVTRYETDPLNYIIILLLESIGQTLLV